MSPAVWFLFFTVVTGSGDVVQTSRHEYTTLTECENVRPGAVEWDKSVVAGRIDDNARYYVTECKFGPPHNAKTEVPDV